MTLKMFGKKGSEKGSIGQVLDPVSNRITIMSNNVKEKHIL